MNIKAVFHKDTKRPACVLLQVLYGGNRSVASLFLPELWHVDCCDDFVMVEETFQRFGEIATRMNKYSSKILKSEKRDQAFS